MICRGRKIVENPDGDGPEWSFRLLIMLNFIFSANDVCFWLYRVTIAWQAPSWLLMSLVSLTFACLAFAVPERIGSL